MKAISQNERGREENPMKITYISHSGFLAETKSYVFLFDYFKGTIPKIPDGKKLIVCASHKHQDHFNPEIFKLAE